MVTQCHSLPFSFINLRWRGLFTKSLGATRLASPWRVIITPQDLTQRLGSFNSMCYLSSTMYEVQGSWCNYSSMGVLWGSGPPWGDRTKIPSLPCGLFRLHRVCRWMLVVYTGCSSDCLWSTQGVQVTACGLHRVFRWLLVVYTGCSGDCLWSTQGVQVTACGLHRVCRWLGVLWRWSMGLVPIPSPLSTVESVCDTWTDGRWRWRMSARSPCLIAQRKMWRLGFVFSSITGGAWFFICVMCVHMCFLL